MPGVTVLAQAAAGDQAMDMRVEVKLLGPGVQDGQHADRAANMAGVAGQLDDRLARRRHQRAIAVALMTAQGGAQLLGHGDGDVEVGARQHLGLTLVQPGPGLFAMAFRAAPVATGMAASAPHAVQRSRCPPRARQARMSAMARRCDGGIDAPWAAW
jgi:hypothetical protein